MTVGEKDGDSDITSPLIFSKNNNNGITSSTNFNFYDGIVKGKNNPINNESRIADIEDDYYLLHTQEVIDGVTYKVVYLSNDVLVSFDPTGGRVDELERALEVGDPIGTLPIATRNGYTFDGWFTAATGGTQITSDYTVTTNLPLYAHWTKNHVAEMNGTHYYSLQDAINDASGQSNIILIDDIDENIVIASGKEINLDLQNHEIGVSSGKQAIINNGKLTISNGTVSSNVEYGSIDNNKGATLNLNNCTVIGQKRPAVYNDKGTVVINGGYFYSEAVGQTSAALLERGTIQSIGSSSNTTIIGATIVSAHQSGISNEGTLTLGSNDGSIDNLPDITGKNHGLLSLGTVNYYDGIIRGENGAISGTITNLATDSHISTDTTEIDGITYEECCLEDD